MDGDDEIIIDKDAISKYLNGEASKINKDDLEKEIEELYERIYRISECTSMNYMKCIYNDAMMRLKSITQPEDMLHKTVGQACVLIENLNQVINEMRNNLFYAEEEEDY